MISLKKLTAVCNGNVVCFCEVQIIHFEDCKCTSGFRTSPFNWSQGQERKSWRRWS